MGDIQVQASLEGAGRGKSSLEANIRSVTADSAVSVPLEQDLTCFSEGKTGLCRAEQMDDSTYKNNSES